MTLFRTATPSSWLGAGKACTVAMALYAALGVAIVPVAVQQVVDQRGDLLVVAVLGAAGLVATTLCAYLVEARLVLRTEALLEKVRAEAFQHLDGVGELSAATKAARTRQAAEDLDRASRFVRWTGSGLLLNGGRLVVVTAVTAAYSWKIMVTLVGMVAVTVAVRNARWHRLRQAAWTVFRWVLGLRPTIRRSVSVAPLKTFDERRRAALSHPVRDEVRLIRRQAGRVFLHEIGMGLMLATLLVGGAYLGAHRQITIGQLAGLLFALMLAVAPFQALASGLREGSDALHRWGRLRPGGVAEEQMTGPVREHV
jgi:hypothetical protein